MARKRIKETEAQSFLKLARRPVGNERHGQDFTMTRFYTASENVEPDVHLFYRLSAAAFEELEKSKEELRLAKAAAAEELRLAKAATALSQVEQVRRYHMANCTG